MGMSNINYRNRKLSLILRDLTDRGSASTYFDAIVKEIESMNGPFFLAFMDGFPLFSIHLSLSDSFGLFPMSFLVGKPNRRFTLQQVFAKRKQSGSL